MPENDRRPHLKVIGTATTEPFVSRQAGSSEVRLAPRDRAQHGTRLLEQVRQAAAIATHTVDEQRAFGVDAGNGVYLEFESEPGFELPTESLDRTRQRIELLAVKEVAGRTVATVFVPEGRLDVFESLIAQYLDRDTSKGRPRNEKLVAQIQQIRLAAVEALWTDDRDLLPEAGVACWWEVWLRVGGDRRVMLGILREHGQRIGLEIADRHLEFPERTVINVRGTKEQLARSVQLLNCVAELRKPKDTAAFYDALTAREQREWERDLLGRSQPPEPDAPFVCLLDTGVNRANRLLSPLLAAGDMYTIEPAWGVDDRYGHGTQMAGLALYGDLVDVLGTRDPVPLTHRLESVKLLDRPGSNAGELHGDLTRQAVARAEITAPVRLRTICMAASSTDGRDRGRPSTWSAAIDGLCSGADDESQRLIVVAAGNVDRDHWSDYPQRNSVEGIHDPGQAWNALTVGSYTDKDRIDPADYPAWEAIAAKGSLSPSSCTSQTWEAPGQLRAQWPLKPDVVFEGGNAALNPAGGADALPSLDLLTTYHQPLVRSFDRFGDTSAATALAARMAAQLQARYPDYWPETIRALVVHSADWTPAMRQAYAPQGTKTEVKILIRHCGFGVPSLERALWSAGNALTLIAEGDLQPFDRVTTKTRAGSNITSVRAKDMNLHRIPWPRASLLELGETVVEMRVTLSYFIEPNPASRGWTRRYRYESHGLRFDVKRPTETVEQFRHRINEYARKEEAGDQVRSDDGGWVVGRARHLGSIHSDRWNGSAADLAERGYIAVYPALGWWRERAQLEGWRKRARYALIVSITTPRVDVDIYNMVAAMVAVPIQVPAR